MLLFSFLIRFTRNIAAMSSVMTALMTVTYYLQMHTGLALLWSGVFFGCLLWVLAASLILKQAMLDLVAEEAWVLYPLSALSSVALGWFLALTVEADLKVEGVESSGLQHLTILLAGIAIALFLLFRCTEIKFLPSIKEIRKD